jgi:hypothetical protein
MYFFYTNFIYFIPYIRILLNTEKINFLREKWFNISGENNSCLFWDSNVRHKCIMLIKFRGCKGKAYGTYINYCDKSYKFTFDVNCILLLVNYAQNV